MLRIRFTQLRVGLNNHLNVAYTVKIDLNNYLNVAYIFKYCENDSSGKQSDPGNFLKARFVIFRCQKYVKKRVHRNDKKNLP